MSIRAFRIIKAKYVPTAFNGEGARLYGGRWNSMGTRMIYLAGSLSGATLELLVHIDDYSTIEGLYSYVPVDLPEELIHSIDEKMLPKGWNASTIAFSTQKIGDEWVASMSSVVLKVPSVITEGEANFLVNPAHEDFPKLRIGEACEFKLDPRI